MRRAFTIIELLVVISIIALLISILLPSLAGARDRARFIKWAGYSHGMRVDTRVQAMWNMENQGESAQRISNKAAGDPFEQAKEDIEPKMMDFYRGTDETVEAVGDPTWLSANDTRTRWKGKGTLEFTAPSSATAQYGKVVGDTNIGGTDVTIIASFRYKSFNRWSRIIDWSNGAGNDNIIVGNDNTSKHLQLNMHDTGQGNKSSRADNILTKADNQWMSWIGTMEVLNPGANGNTQYKHYQNGKLFKTQNFNNGNPAKTAVPKKKSRSTNYIARSPWGGDWEYNGFMDEIIYMKEAIDADEAGVISSVGAVRKKD